MKYRVTLALTVVLALTGCNQYSTPALQSSPRETDATPLNNQADPSQTTGSVGGAPGGTSSLQTVPSSSNGVR